MVVASKRGAWPPFDAPAPADPVLAPVAVAAADWLLWCPRLRELALEPGSTSLDGRTGAAAAAAAASASLVTSLSLAGLNVTAGDVGTEGGAV